VPTCLMNLSTVADRTRFGPNGDRAVPGRGDTLPRDKGPAGRSSRRTDARLIWALSMYLDYQPPRVGCPRSCRNPRGVGDEKAGIWCVGPDDAFHSRVSAARVYPVAVPVPGSVPVARGWFSTGRTDRDGDGRFFARVARRPEGDQAGPVTMTPPVKPVNAARIQAAGPCSAEAARRAWPDRVLNNSPMRDGEPYNEPGACGPGYGDRGEGRCGAENGRKAL